jgi:hypothetical protein
MKFFILFILMFSISTFSFSCEEIIGTFNSDGPSHYDFEGHWKYTVEIYSRGSIPEGIEISYSTYWFGSEEDGLGDEQYQTNTTYEGYCVESKDGYHLKFNENVVRVSFDKEGSQPSITGEFFKGRNISLRKLKQ